MVTTIHKCDKHGELPQGTNHCSACEGEKCEHGCTLAGHCVECSADTSWQTAPLTDEECRSVGQELVRYGGPFRMPSKPRNFHCVSLFGILFNEYQSLRKRYLLETL